MSNNTNNTRKGSVVLTKQVRGMSVTYETLAAPKDWPEFAELTRKFYSDVPPEQLGMKMLEMVESPPAGMKVSKLKKLVMKMKGDM
ncbi:hypothetical protein MMC25_000593 [Agyrium rufum]|nr:hypothetical protein [Agyrium rufum]